MTTIKDKRSKIFGYIDKYDRSPLIFKRCYSEDLKEYSITEYTDTMSLRDLIYSILEMSKSYGSFNERRQFMETSNGRLRSSLDIWRHVIKYRPDVDIFSVMECLYSMREDIYGHYCPTVRRAVFKSEKPVAWAVIRSPKRFKSKEYDLTFFSWKKLHYKGETKYE